MAYREAPNINEEVPIRRVVRAEAIRDDGTTETVEIGAFERACVAWHRNREMGSVPALNSLNACHEIQLGDAGIVEALGDAPH